MVDTIGRRGSGQQPQPFWDLLYRHLQGVDHPSCNLLYRQP